MYYLLGGSPAFCLSVSSCYMSKYYVGICTTITTIQIHVFHFICSPTHPPTFRESATRRFEQDVEQARPTDTSEEEMQLKLALQLSKQQADEEERLK